MADKAFSTRNAILLALPSPALALLRPHLDRVNLPLRKQLEQTSKPVKKAYFIESGMASVVAKVHRKDIEVGIIGREGMTGMSLVMGVPLPMQDIFIQMEGAAQAVDADQLKELMSANADLQKAFLVYAYSFSLQSAQTAAANGHGKLDERLARWLLMAHDRVDGDGVPLTHEFLSTMLGVRRAGVSEALKDLASARLIAKKRNIIIISDRKGLEKLADGIYAAPTSVRNRAEIPLETAI